VVSGGTAQIIEYEIVPWSDILQMGDLGTLLADSMGAGTQVGILRCVVEDGRRVTFVGDARATSKLVRIDGAGTSSGVRIEKKDFPVMLEGWPFRLRAE
jgi:hypothetical protein